MASKGVFAVSREIWDDPDFADEPFTQREAWMWLIGAACWKDQKVRGGEWACRLKAKRVLFFGALFGWQVSVVKVAGQSFSRHAKKSGQHQGHVAGQ